MAEVSTALEVCSPPGMAQTCGGELQTLSVDGGNRGLPDLRGIHFNPAQTLPRRGQPFAKLGPTVCKVYPRLGPHLALGEETKYSSSRFNRRGACLSK